MAIQKTRGFVLRREDIRETSVLLTVYTRDFGKLKLISKGVRIPEQRFISSYELFALDEIVFYEKKKKDVYLLSQCELAEYFPKVRESLERLSYAVYFIELLDFVTALEDRNARLYELLLNSLELLSTGASPKRIARIFEIRLLSALGFMPGLKICASCNKELKGEKTRFSLKMGGVLCGECSKSEKAARPIMQGTINFISSIERLPFERIRQIKVATPVGREVERLLKDFISYHLAVRTRSMEFISKVGL